MIEKLILIAELTGAITAIVTFICLITKPIRNRLLGLTDVIEGQKCLLRQDMLNIYYKHRESNTIRQYEYENFVYLYNAYKRLKGNSFIDKIYKEIQTWEVVS